MNTRRSSLAFIIAAVVSTAVLSPLEVEARPVRHVKPHVVSRPGRHVIPVIHTVPVVRPAIVRRPLARVLVPAPFGFAPRPVARR